MKVLRGSERRRKLERPEPVNCSPRPVSSGWPVSQDQARERWRGGYTLQVGSDFDLGAELEFLCRGLDTAVASLQHDVWAVVVVEQSEIGGVAHHGFTPGWTTTRKPVRVLCEAVFACFETVVKVLADNGGLSAESRAWALEMQKLGAPTISDEQLSSGGWVEVLSVWVSPLVAELRAVLGRVTDVTIAQPDWWSDSSADLVVALRRVDSAASGLRWTISTVRRAVPLAREKRAADAAAERARQRVELAKMGL